MSIYMWREQPPLCFTANTAGSTIKLTLVQWSPSGTFETSTDRSSRSDYTAWNTITLSNIWDKVYWRNKSWTQTALNALYNYYRFDMTWSIAASWDIWYMLCKNCTQTLSDQNCFYRLFYWCTSLTSTPTISFTTDSGVWWYFLQTFQWCSNITTLPKLPLTTLQNQTYQATFNNCSKIKLSTTQDSNYTQPYRIPREWTWTVSWTPFTNMFANTWWSFTWTPSANTTYYLHKDNTIV